MQVTLEDAGVDQVEYRNGSNR